jgi:hypothetical protein
LEYNSARVEINAAIHNVPGIETVNVDDEITFGRKEESALGGAQITYLTTCIFPRLDMKQY